MALSRYHHISLVQNKHLDLLGVNELQFGAPVQDGPRGTDDNLLTHLLTSFHCAKEKFSSGIPKTKPVLGGKSLLHVSEVSEQVNVRFLNVGELVRWLSMLRLLSDPRN